MEIIQKFIKKQNDLWMESQVTIAFLGDSVTQGCFEVYWKENVGIHTVFEQEKGYHRILAKLLAMLYPSVPVTVINAGISGDNAPHGLQRLERDVISHNPDLVVVCFGLNDAMSGIEHIPQYLNALEGIFEQLKCRGIETIFMTPNMMATEVCDSIADPRIRAIASQAVSVQNDGILDAYMQQARAVCERQRVRVCDCYAKWKQLQRNGVNITQLLSNQINHPTPEMHALFATSLLEQMLS